MSLSVLARAAPFLNSFSASVELSGIMSSDSDIVDTPEACEPKAKVKFSFRKRKTLSQDEILAELGSSSDECDLDDSDCDPDYELPEIPSAESSIIETPRPYRVREARPGEPSTSSGVVEEVPTLPTAPSGGTEVTEDEVIEETCGRGTREGSVGSVCGGNRGKRSRSVTPKRGRKQGRFEAGWKQNIAKRLRQEGKEYVSVKTKQTVVKRQPGPMCKDRCIERVPQECRDEIFKNCWKIGNYDARLNYYNSCVSEGSHKRKYRDTATPLRPMRLSYSVKSRGIIYPVCRSGFQAIHGITYKEMRVFLQKRKDSPTGALPSDQRGRMKPGCTIKGVKLERVHEHIRLLSVTSSHYSRIKNPHRQYAGVEGLSVPILFSEYQLWMKEKYPEEEQVLFSFYKKIFTTQYNIAFKKPPTDLCNECAALGERVKTLRGREEPDQEELQDAQEEEEKHRALAREAQDLLKAQQAEEDQDSMVIAVDLQQTLPVPKLNINRAYYTRKLWLYNLCVYDVKAQKPTLYLWDETQGGRGADDIASCIHRWIRDNANGRKKLKIFADNCAAQNKNRTIVLMALQKVHQKILDRVDFIYLVSGHSYLPCDRVFGNIEKKLRTLGNIPTPVRYASIIESSTKVPPTIVRLGIADFLAFSALENYCKWATPSGTMKGAFQKARQFVVTKDYPAGYLVKLHYAQEETDRNHCPVSLCLGSKKGKGRGKGRRPAAEPAPVADFNLAEVALSRRYPGEAIKLNEFKLRDLQHLLPYIEPEGRAWIAGVLEQQNLLVEGAPEGAAEEEAEDDPDNDAMEFEAVRCTSRL